MKSFLIPLFAVPFFSIHLVAQEPEAASPPAKAAEAKQPDPFNGDGGYPSMIRVQVEFVELSHETLTDLLFLADPPSADATSLRKQVQELVKKGEAKVMETLLGTGRSEETTSVESINELIYPTEYEPWEVPNEVDVPDKPGGITPDDVRAMESLVTPATPTSFETRNLGSVLEFRASSGEDGKFIDLKLAPDLVWHTGESVWIERKDGLGNSCKVQMPKIYSMRLNTSLTCKEGQYILAAALSPKDAVGTTDSTRKVMVFVKCDVIVVK